MKKKEHSNDIRNLVIRHYQNGDSLSESVAKTLLSQGKVQYMIDKYKSTKCISHLLGHARKRETDRLIQCKVKLDQRKSASTVEVEIENKQGIILHIVTIRRRAHEVG